MLELVKSGGWLMMPIVACSVIAMAICLERLWTLRASSVAPAGLLGDLLAAFRKGKLETEQLAQIRNNSPLGRIMVAGIKNANHGRDVMKESIEEAASEVIHELERFLSPLGTIAAITPLLGLLGTVIGMIKVFNEIMIQGTGNASVLAGGISEALITTASGLAVAIPALIFHRFFLRRIDSLVVSMEQQAVKLVEMIHGQREED
ncbi:MotA/TolQ/ExbB proton channel family protein [Pontibacterium sp.]|uniref:MotA/TolQ/ExbB proton channel family protein n=1 Tax=Pontibacterium sp. TaxID=2036026 RepID=UPI00356265DB